MTPKAKTGATATLTWRAPKRLHQAAPSPGGAGGAAAASPSMAVGAAQPDGQPSDVMRGVQVPGNNGKLLPKSCHNTRHMSKLAVVMNLEEAEWDGIPSIDCVDEHLQDSFDFYSIRVPGTGRRVQRVRRRPGAAARAPRRAARPGATTSRSSSGP